MHVIGGKINTLQTEVDELRDSQYSHADALQCRSAQLSVVHIQVRVRVKVRDLTIQPVSHTDTLQHRCQLFIYNYIL